MDGWMDGRMFKDKESENLGKDKEWIVLPMPYPCKLDCLIYKSLWTFRWI